MSETAMEDDDDDDDEEEEEIQRLQAEVDELPLPPENGILDRNNSDYPQSPRSSPPQTPHTRSTTPRGTRRAITP